MMNIRMIQNSVKPLMTHAFQKLHLQELDMSARKEKEPSLPWRHFVKSQALNHWAQENALGGIIGSYIVGESEGTKDERRTIEEIQEVD